MRRSFFSRRFALRLVAAGLAVALLSSPSPGQFWKKWFRRPVSNQTPLVVEILDIGQGDSIFIQSPEGKTALIDAGTSKRAAELLQEKGITSLDLVAVSHHHTDHYGGMDEVITDFSPKYFLASGTSHVTSMYKKLLEHVKSNGMTAVEPTEKPRRISLGSVTLTILPQPPENEEEENNNSIGIRLDYGDFSMLMTGDSEEAERAWWMVNCPELLRDCEILKLAHHGSRNGTDSRWLDLVKPRLVVASLGKDNSFGHPHKETVELLEQYNIPFSRTDQVGTIVIHSDGVRWEQVKDAELLAKSGGKSDDSVRRTGTGGSSKSKRATGDVESDGLVNLNTASRAALETIPGVNSATAKKIIIGRPYKSVDELQEVDGISATLARKIRPKVKVQ